MPKLTIDLPEATYRDVLTFSESERVLVIVNAFATARNEVGDHHLTTDEDIAAIRESLAQEAAGQVIDGDELMAQLREQYGWTKK